MELKLLPLEMYFTEEGYICLNQTTEEDEKAYVVKSVLLSADMVDTVCDKLQKMKNKMEQNGTNGTDNVNVNDNVNDLIEPSQTMFLNSLSATSVAEDSFPF